MTWAEAWEEERTELIKKANINTFVAVEEAFEKGWKRAMNEIEKCIDG